jgi:exopolyphosphatase/guanosine-5'-triphosphate,3'-diphosphate pyrophosphatase
LAALDLGTNNCRLLIAAPLRDGTLRIVDSFSRIVRLGEGVARTGLLSDAAIERTVAALKICAGRLAKSRVKKLRAVATEACRRAANAELLVRRVAQETGIALDIVSTEEEARLAAVGCAPLIGEDYDGALAFDIGGGSTETIWLERNGGAPQPLHFASVPQGVMSWEDEADDRAAYDAMRAAMTARFKEVRRAMDARGRFDAARHHLLGTSGTVTTLAGVAMALPRYVRSRVDASWHDCAAILAVAERLVAMEREARARLGCVGEERADLIVAGCAIFAAIVTVWPCSKLRVADRGLREGILRELMAGR